ncbi:hypothetical protein ACU4GD_27500 [Cupriavidus basilensis]
MRWSGLTWSSTAFLPSPSPRCSFPNHDENTSLLLTLGTFGVSFSMRPLGAVVIGVYADRKAPARRADALHPADDGGHAGSSRYSPPSAAIGVMAPIGTVLARMIQGFSAGGEFGSATAFLRRARAQAGAVSTPASRSPARASPLQLAAGFGAVLHSPRSRLTRCNPGGWRVPFLFGLLLGPVAYYIRRHVDETPEFLQAETTETHAARHTLSHSKESPGLLAKGVVIVATVSTYLVLCYAHLRGRQPACRPSAASAALRHRPWRRWCSPRWSGHWSDRYGRIPPMRLARSAVAGVDLAAVLAAQPLSRLRRDAGGAGGARDWMMTLYRRRSCPRWRRRSSRSRRAPRASRFARTTSR